MAAAGLSFGYWVLLPRAVHWLTNYDKKQFHIIVQAKAYYSFVVDRAARHDGRVRAAARRARARVHRRAGSSAACGRNRRLGYFIVAVVALAPAGARPVTTALELLPMWALFEGSIWLACFTERRRQAAPIRGGTLSRLWLARR